MTNGEEAVNTLRLSTYDLVLMDVQMPVMDGLEATRIIRAPKPNGLNQKIPIIAMTANAMKGDREKCMDVGMDDYVPKPISYKILVETLSKWLPQTIISKVDHSPNQSEDLPTKSIEEPQTLVFDKAGMMANFNNDENMACTIMKFFLNDLPAEIESLNNAIQAGDVAVAERQAHTIKSAAATVGGESLRRVAFELEMYGRDGDIDAIKARLSELDIQFAFLKEEVEYFLSSVN